MPRRLDRVGIDPERMEMLHCAYEAARAKLGLLVMPDKINEILVTKIMELGRTERDPARLCDQVLQFYGELRSP